MSKEQYTNIKSSDKYTLFFAVLFHIKTILFYLHIKCYQTLIDVATTNFILKKSMLYVCQNKVTAGYFSLQYFDLSS